MYECIANSEKNLLKLGTQTESTNQNGKYISHYLVRLWEMSALLPEKVITMLDEATLKVTSCEVDLFLDVAAEDRRLPT